MCGAREQNELIGLWLNIKKIFRKKKVAAMVEFNLMLEYSFIYGPLLFDLSGAETRILWDSWVNNVVADTRLPWVARSSATNLLV